MNAFICLTLRGPSSVHFARTQHCLFFQIAKGITSHTMRCKELTPIWDLSTISKTMNTRDNWSSKPNFPLKRMILINSKYKAINLDPIFHLGMYFGGKQYGNQLLHFRNRSNYDGKSRFFFNSYSISPNSAIHLRPLIPHHCWQAWYVQPVIMHGKLVEHERLW